LGIGYGEDSTPDAAGTDIVSTSPETRDSGAAMGTIGSTLLVLAVFFFGGFFANVLTAFLGVATAFGFAFLLAGRAAFLATLFALRAVFPGRAFFFAALPFATLRFVFATGRCFALLFFALLFFFAMIIISSRSYVAARHESIPEKVRCHLRMMLESASCIA
jgi:hypothetical protein